MLVPTLGCTVVDLGSILSKAVETGEGARVAGARLGEKAVARAMARAVEG